MHTPDGAPCGLLNHLSARCQVITKDASGTHLQRLLASLGMLPLASTTLPTLPTLPVVLNGRLLGWIESENAAELAVKLRTLKALGKEKVSGLLLQSFATCFHSQVPKTLEIGLVPILKKGQFPGLFLFTTVSRMMRPVTNLATNTVELIGSFEQVLW